MRYTYSYRDQSLTPAAIDAEDLMAALSDDVIAEGSISSALQRVIRWGLKRDEGSRLPGLQNLLQQLRLQRQQELERYNLDSFVEDFRKRVDTIVDVERHSIEQRREESLGVIDPGIQAMLDAVMERKRSALDRLPDDVGARIANLAEYEFLEDEARSQFDAVMDELQQHVLRSHSEGIRQTLQGLASEDAADVKSMLRDLNAVLQDKIAGRSPDFRGFMEQHDRFFPDTSSLDQLVAQMQEHGAYTHSLLRSMSSEVRHSLERMMMTVLRDDELRAALGQVAEAMQSIAPLKLPHPRFPFSGDESLTFEEALHLMRRMHELERLESELNEAQESGDLDRVNGDRLRQVMGGDTLRAFEQLQRLTSTLEIAGYMQKVGDSFELTARGVRKIGQRALQDIFQHLKQDAFGSHSTFKHGAGRDRADETKRYEFGDAFLLDINQTLMNAVRREGANTPLRVAVQDFEVFRSESLTQSSTVLMLDMSRSMPLRGCFVAAKKVAFALNSLITTKYPRDHLYIVGFSDFARELRPEALHQVTWGDYVYGTNMQHGFMLARRLLGRLRVSNKQIILITDGEPTAHFEGERVQFSYPPTFRTFQETLREVGRCTQEGIVINTFMLERSHYLADFVNQMTKINKGRAFFATPEKLGDYILVDYVTNRESSMRIRETW